MAENIFHKFCSLFCSLPPPPFALPIVCHRLRRAANCGPPRGPRWEWQLATSHPNAASGQLPAAAARLGSRRLLLCDYPGAFFYATMECRNSLLSLPSSPAMRRRRTLPPRSVRPCFRVVCTAFSRNTQPPSPSTTTPTTTHSRHHAPTRSHPQPILCYHRYGSRTQKDHNATRLLANRNSTHTQLPHQRARRRPAPAARPCQRQASRCRYRRNTHSIYLDVRVRGQERRGEEELHCPGALGHGIVVARKERQVAADGRWPRTPKAHERAVQRKLAGVQKPANERHTGRRKPQAQRVCGARKWLSVRPRVKVRVGPAVPNCTGDAASGNVQAADVLVRRAQYAIPRG
jgi:hypothetical protein